MRLPCSTVKSCHDDGMEAIDQEILALLSANGRMSFTDVGKATGLSTSAAQQRVRRLEQRGLIRGYRADINPSAVGRGMMAFISVRPMKPRDDDTIPEQLTQIPEITSCYSVAGDSSFILVAQVASPAALDVLLGHVRRSANVMTTTTVVLTTIFEDRPLVGLPQQSG